MACNKDTILLFLPASIPAPRLGSWLHVLPHASPSCTVNGTDVYQKHRVRWERENHSNDNKSLALLLSHLSPVWIPGVFQKLCLPVLRWHEWQPLIPGWHQLLPFAVALRHKVPPKCLAAVLKNTSSLDFWSSCTLIPSIWKPLILLKGQISELAFPHNHRYFKYLAK